MAEHERDYHAGVDGLESDMANHQRRFSGEVTARANHELAVQTIERIEKQDAEKRPPPVSPEPPPGPPPTGSEDRQVEDRKYVLDKGPDSKKMFRTASEFEHQVLRHAMPRVRLLMTKVESGLLGTPSWRARTMAAMYFKVKSVEAQRAGKFDLADNYERAYQVDLEELLEASNAPFGEWRKDPEHKLIIT